MTKLFFSNIGFPILTDGTQSRVWKEKNNTWLCSLWWAARFRKSCGSWEKTSGPWNGFQRRGSNPPTHRLFQSYSWRHSLQALNQQILSSHWTSSGRHLGTPSAQPFSPEFIFNKASLPKSWEASPGTLRMEPKPAMPTEAQSTPFPCEAEGDGWVSLLFNRHCFFFSCGYKGWEIRCDAFSNNNKSFKACQTG